MNTPTLSFDDRGTGTGLVLLHGFPLDRSVWRQQVEELSKDMRVIAPDLRGFGRSPRAEGPFSLTDLADDVHRLIASLGLKKVVLAGLSMGGYIAEAFVAKYAESLAGLVIIDSKVEPDSTEGKAARDKMIALVKEKGSAAVAEQMLPKMLAPSHAKDGSLATELRAIMEACPPDTIAYAIAAMRDRPDRAVELAKLRIPALVIVGEHDAIISLEVAKKTSMKIPGATLHVVPNAGHMSPMEAPTDVNEALRAFVRNRVIA